MKHYFSFLVILSAWLNPIQAIENDWINYSQSYYKFPIHKDGIYRLNYLELINAGIAISTIDSRQIQVFGKGEELHLFINDGGDNIIGSSSGAAQGDYIEFYAEKNDGWYDHVLFADSLHHGNPQYSMFTDTLYYYLTWNDRVDNKRMSLEPFDRNHSYPTSSYFWNELEVVQNTHFASGELTYFNRPTPEYSPGVGWAGKPFSFDSPRNISVSTPNAFRSGPDATVYASLIGQSRNNHAATLEVAGQFLAQKTTTNYKMMRFENAFSSALIEDALEVNFRNSTSSGNAKSKLAISRFKIRYPRTYSLNDATEFKMHVPPGSEDSDHLRISNFNNVNSTVWLYDLTAHKKVSVQSAGGIFEALLPNQGKERLCFLVSEAAISSIRSSVIKAVSGSSSLFKNYQAMASDQGGVNYFIVSASKLLEGANEYEEYRNTTGHRAMAIDAEQLYDQYSYGVRKHPMAIRNFVLNAHFNWGAPIEHLLLLGKSVGVSGSRPVRSNSGDRLNLLPTWGSLGADVGFTNGVAGSSVLEPTVPTGRIAANSVGQVRGYLNKIKDYEAAEAASWMKEVLHFGGGISSSEQKIFKGYLSAYEDIIESTDFGAQVHTFLKSSADPLQINLSDSVTNLINQGVTLMTFFGHAYGSNFDQSIDEPENYNNSGKYGFILANSCLIGNIHSGSTTSGSERFVLSEDRGTIGFLGSSALGVASYLDKYSKKFYEHLAKDSYGKSVGVIMKESIKSIQDSSQALSRDVCMHMTLHGDPAVVLNAHAKPDYSLYSRSDLNAAQIYFSPAKVTSELDSFAIEVIVNNIGKAQKDTLVVEIKRSFPTGVDTIYTVFLTDVFYKDTLRLRMPVDVLQGAGLNVFEVTLNPLSVVDELSELNNVAAASLVVSASEITPVYPYEFAVVPDRYPVLRASTGDAYAATLTYVFQIDTNADFSSVSLYEENISNKGGVVSWNPETSVGLKSFFNGFPPTTTIENPNVYFWRVSPQTSQQDKTWRSSSFEYVSGKSGWGQAHFHQYKDNPLTFLSYDKNGGKFEFIKQYKRLDVTTSGYRNGDNKHPLLKLDGAIMGQFTRVYWKRSYINVAVVDKLTLDLWRYDEHGDYRHIQMTSPHRNAPNWNEENFQFDTNLSGMDSLISFVNDVPDSNYLMFYDYLGSRLPGMYTNNTSTGIALKALMKSLGADVEAMVGYQNSYPYAFFTQKGNPSKAKERFSSSQGEVIELKGEMQNNWLDGTMKSTMIGPAKSWDSFHWQVQAGESGNLSDSSHIKLYAIGNNGAKKLVLDTAASRGDLFTLNSLDASEFPNLMLELYLSDDNLRTPRNLARWQVLYEEIPEAALNPSILVTQEIKDTVQQGENYLFTTAIENISNQDMSPVQVVYWILDERFNLEKASYRQLDALPAGEVLYDTLSLNTLNLSGGTSLWYEVNPYNGAEFNEGEVPWQQEQHHFNNIHLANFHVASDKINPILDVTFDGIHILDGDIVSPEPFVVISLDDENQYLALDDPSLIKLYIEYPNTTDSIVLLDPSEYTFIPGEAPKNKARIEFQGAFVKDGVYKLKVQSTDRSSNVSGKPDGNYDYSISFEVINKSSITQVLNWPNPFSSSTQFVFTLTGSVIPDQFMIQILTITGKVVREISKDEYGAINIGRNISDFRWDGTDSYGDRLANGVYLYRVMLNTEDHNFEERTTVVADESGTSSLKDKYFKKGFGKMYLMR